MSLYRTFCDGNTDHTMNRLLVSLIQCIQVGSTGCPQTLFIIEKELLHGKRNR